MFNRQKVLLSLVFFLALFVSTSSWAAVSPDEQAFFRDVERPQVKARQKLGGWFGFGNAEGLLWRSALEVLSDKTAGKLATADNCEMATWVAARNEASSQALNRFLVPLASEVMTSGLSASLMAFSFPGKILLTHSLTLSIRLFNRSMFGLLETKDIPPEVIRTITNITIGYMAPHLTNDYFSQKLIETAAPPAINNLLSSLMEKEETIVSRVETSNASSRNFGPRSGLPLVRVTLVLVYSPYTHFVTLFVRGVGEGCPGNRLFVLQYEVDKNGLLDKDTPTKDRPVINLEPVSPQLGVTDRRPTPSPTGPTATACTSRPIPNIRRLEGHTGLISSVAFVPGEPLVASGSYDGSVRFWNLRNNIEADPVNTKDRVTSLAFNPTGTLLAVGTYSLLTVAPFITNFRLSLWDAKRMVELQPLVGITEMVREISFSPDGRLVAAAHGKAVSVWHVTSREQVQGPKSFNNSSTTVVFSPDGRFLAVGGADGAETFKVRVWDIREKKEIRDFNVIYPAATAFSREGLLAISRKYGEIELVDPVSGRQVRRLTWKNPGFMTRIVFAPDGVSVALADGDGLFLLDVSNGRELWSLVNQDVRDFAFGKGGDLAWVGRDRRVRVWNKSLGLRNLAPREPLPSIPYEHPGLCPFEGCTYREWTANKDMITRKENSERSPIAFSVKKGEKVEAITGTVLTLRAGCAEALNTLNVGDVRLTPGSIIHPLTYAGEGTWSSWVQGTLAGTNIEEDFEMIEYPVAVWWVKIRNARGQIGWSNQPENFDNKSANFP